MKIPFSGSAICCGLALGWVVTARSAPPAATPERHPVITSARQWFVVVGLPMGDATEMAAWAEDTASRLERKLDIPMPMGKHQSIQIIFREDDRVAHGQVLRAQGWSDGRLVQRLVLVNKGRVTQEDVLEGLCRLLVNRYAIVRQPGSSDQAAAELPDWFSVGLAQNLFPELRSRNAVRALELFDRSEVVPVETVLTWRYLPEGRSSDKAFCGVFVDWLHNTVPDLWPGLVSQAARGESITAPWILSNRTGAVSARELEMEWVLWVAHQQNIRRQVGDQAAVPYTALGEALTIRPAEYGITLPGRERSELTPADLITLRQESWMPGLIARLRPRLQSLALGQPAEFQETVKSYLEFFQALSEAVEPPRQAGLFSSIPNQKRLAGLLAEAEQRRATLETQLLARSGYLDELAEESLPSAEPAPASDWDWIVNELEKQDVEPSAVEDYLDQIERRLEPDR